MKKIIGFFIALTATFAFCISTYAAYGTIIDGSSFVPAECFIDLGLAGSQTRTDNGYSYVLVYNDNGKYHNMDIKISDSGTSSFNTSDSNGNIISVNSPVLYINGKIYIGARAAYVFFTEYMSDKLAMSWNGETKIAHFSMNGKNTYINCVDVSKLPYVQGAGKNIICSDLSGKINIVPSSNTTPTGTTSQPATKSTPVPKSAPAPVSNNKMGIKNEDFTEIKTIFDNYIAKLDYASVPDICNNIAKEALSENSEFYKFIHDDNFNYNTKVFAITIAASVSDLAILKYLYLVVKDVEYSGLYPGIAEALFPIYNNSVEYAKKIFDVNSVAEASNMGNYIQNTVNFVLDQISKLTGV